MGKIIMKEQPVRIILGNALMNNGNRGCIALTVATLYLIDLILSECDRQYEIYLTKSGFYGDGWRECKILDKKIPYYVLREPSFSPFQLFNEVKDVRTFIKRCRLYHSADIIMDLGLGDSFADIYGIQRFASIDHIHKIARLLRKKYVFLPQTIGPFEDEKVKGKAVKSLQRSQKIMARDKQSLLYTQQIVKGECEVDDYLDMAFFLPFKSEVFSTEFIHVGLNVSSLLWNGGYTSNNQFGLKVNYQELIHSIITFFLNQDNVMLHLVPHVVLGERDVENDYEVSYELSRHYSHKRISLAPFFLGPIEAKNYISGLDFFIGARMHSNIAAFSSGTPVIPLAYSRKTNGLFEDTLQYHHIADMKQQATAEIMQRIKDGFIDRGKLREEITICQHTIIKDKKEKLIDDLSRLLL